MNTHAVAEPIISREIDALAEHFKNYTSGPGFDVLRLITAHRHWLAVLDDRTAQVRDLKSEADFAHADNERRFSVMRERVRELTDGMRYAIMELDRGRHPSAIASELAYLVSPVPAPATVKP